ncbi:MAG: sigma factor-like helix-turn-helix DNA-binding protein [Verrucomicrobiaceae bacterium]
MKAKFSSVSFEVGIEQLERMKEPPQLSHVSGKELRDLLDKHLTPLESQILQMRFGLDGPELTQWETAKEIGTYSATRIGQLEAKALRKLKGPRVARVLLEKLDELE